MGESLGFCTASFWQGLIFFSNPFGKGTAFCQGLGISFLTASFAAASFVCQSSLNSLAGILHTLQSSACIHQALLGLLQGHGVVFFEQELLEDLFIALELLDHCLTVLLALLGEPFCFLCFFNGILTVHLDRCTLILGPLGLAQQGLPLFCFCLFLGLLFLIFFVFDGQGPFSFSFA